MIGSIDIRVRYAETDQMGRAHHSNNLVWCELGRTTLMREQGVSYAEMEQTGVILPVARAEVEYRAPLLYDQVVRIETRVERVRSRDILFGYSMTRDVDGVLAATAMTTLVSADTAGRPIRLPHEIRAVLERLVDR
jgi:acyl-CoA thioester hydrolase